MLPKSLFKKPRNQLEGYDVSLDRAAPLPPEESSSPCPDCKRKIYANQMIENLYVCPHCGWHFRIGGRQRIALIIDQESFSEINESMETENILAFPGYDEKLALSKTASGEKEAVITGTGRISGIPCAIFSMDPYFMMGSMGSVVGEKIVRLFEYATDLGLPVVGFTVSGGARIQEGIMSLMQMAKTSGAVKYHSEAGLLYVAVLTDPTTGGVTASFAMEADIALSEPRALIGFAGPRVIEQTIRQKLPEGFQKAEFLLKKGFVDKIVDRRALRTTLFTILRLHGLEARHEGI